MPVEFRALASGGFDGVYCFPSIDADCLEGGGQAFFDRYKAMIEEQPFGDPLRNALETSFYGGISRLGFDGAGRITLPEHLCDAFGLTDWITVVGLSDRFQIWSKDAFQAHRSAQREIARSGIIQLREAQRAARIAGGG